MQDHASQRRFALGCDVGATKVSLSLGFTSGEVSDRITDTTHRMKEPETLVREVSSLVQRVVERNGLSIRNCIGLGVAFAGPVNGREGTVLYAPNIPGWDNIGLKKLLEQSLELPVTVMNDANVGALGEYRHGGTAGPGDMLYITISTGIGAGIIVDGKPYEGALSVAGEIGHVTVIENGPRCGCGKSGCLESIASGLAVERQAVERMAREETSLRDRAVKEGNRITSAIVFEEARKGDPLASEIVETACRYLGLVIAGAVMLMSFSTVVLGGGMAREGEYIRKRVEFHMRKALARGPNEAVRLLVSRMPDSIVDIGALDLAFDRWHSQQAAKGA